MKYLRKQNDPTVHIATDLLKARGDMIECDKHGNPLTVGVAEPAEPAAPAAPAAPAPKRTAKQQAVDALPDDITICGV